MDKRDILLVMSDQHSWTATGFCDGRLDTPQMERIAAEGSLFESCYCTGPICVPSRMSFLTGKMPSELEIFNNDSALASDVPTIAHDMGALGYHTVLLGRMHFKGDDQNHGFMERRCGDITSQYWGTGGGRREDFGDYRGTTNRKHCLKMAGGGMSPVMYYDRLILEEVLQFLKNWQKKRNRPPLFLIVGFYSPHFPFVSESELFSKYQERISVQECAEAMAQPSLSIYRELTQHTTAEHMRDCQAAYYGLVETLDSYIGEIYDEFLKMEKGREYIFGYTSDHGEQLGRRGIFGKQTFYEDAVHIPLILAGTGIPQVRVGGPVSLLHLARSLKELGCGQEFTAMEGWKTAWEAGTGSWVRIQQMLTHGGEKVLAEAAVNGRYKVICVNGSFFVYDLAEDPQERNNLVERRKETAQREIMHAHAAGCFLKEQEVSRLCQREVQRCEEQKRLKAWGESVCPKEWATVNIPSGTLIYPSDNEK